MKQRGFAKRFSWCFRYTRTPQMVWQRFTDHRVTDGETGTKGSSRPLRFSSARRLAPRPGFEPGTYGLEVRCSIQLSYRGGWKGSGIYSRHWKGGKLFCFKDGRRIAQAVYPVHFQPRILPCLFLPFERDFRESHTVLPSAFPYQL